MKSSQEVCTSSHVTKIAGLEEKLVRQAGMLEEVVDKVLVVIIILIQISMIIFYWILLSSFGREAGNLSKSQWSSSFSP